VVREQCTDLANPEDMQVPPMALRNARIYAE